LENRILKKYVERYASSNVLMRGKRLYSWQYVKVQSIDFQHAKAVLKVKSEQFRFREYDVKISGFDVNDIRTSCTCAYEEGGICKHRVAALMEIDRQLADQKLTYSKYNPADFTVTLPAFEENLIAAECSEEDFIAAQLLVAKHKVKILTALNNEASFRVEQGDEDFSVRLERKAAKLIHTTCTCKDERNPICVHKAASLLQLRERFGDSPFDEMRDWTKEKNQMLAEYGYSLSDDLSRKFDFKVVSGNLQLVVLDKSIHKLSPYQNWQSLQHDFFYRSNEFDIPELSKSGALRRSKDIAMLVYLVSLEKDAGKLPGFTVTPFKCKLSSKTGKLTYLRDISGIQGEPDWIADEQDIELIKITRAINKDGLTKYVKNEDIPYKWDYWAQEPLVKEKFKGDGFYRVQEYVGEHLEALLGLFSQKKVFLNVRNLVAPTYDDLQPFPLSTAIIRPTFVLKEEADQYVLQMWVECEGKLLPLKKIKTIAYWLVQYEETYYKIASLADANLVHYFEEHGAVKMRKNEQSEAAQQAFSSFFRDMIMPIASRYPLELKINREIRKVSLQPRPKLYVKEADKYLMLVPAFEYEYEGETQEFAADGASQFLKEDQGQLLLLQRDTEKENETLEFIKSLHPDWANIRVGTQAGKSYFYLHFDDVMKDGWFFGVFDRIKEKDIPVFGFQNLTNLKYNPHRPVMQMRSSSGIDWFDLQIEITFGDQTVSLSSVRKAVLNKQNYVQLGDGTLGLLPEEWLQKYASVFRLGNVKDGHIELSKKHFSVIDTLYEEIDNLEILREVEEKKRKLLNFTQIPQVDLPQNVRATLRDYQVEGFKWLNFLDEFGWGGCLADDMGLGKTLQVLAFLQHQKEVHGRVTSLVVVPTTLIFNWNAEVEKFCPDLKVYTHRGLDRRKGIQFFDDYDIVLSTYGTVRSDVELLTDYPFHYIILDESQAIKNPNSQIARSVKLLKAKNRLVMTGTPIENNTFDLYSQIDFLNPGLLGGQDFFKSEYATPIDKYRDSEKAQELRKIVYPFMLKRTKEEVAKDLPDKTETVLYCEMETHQRKVYEAFKIQYKEQILKKISEEGMSKSGFLILEGLLKLRQICDSPALLSESTSGDEDYGSESAKLNELIREIEENASNHKILIFSQFLKMLDLIRERLNGLHIKYQYLDGQTLDRAEKVNSFQEDAETRVFLMSLKAGGVGINLTEADYVYLVDPWWNPAVEQQAIDRTHRIGQTKKIFAYRMICKDSIEEKILQLQEKKKLLAEDIISTESGFMKKLTQEDIVDLFS
jgi:uncharacterized Zn finger protein